ncbi:MAG: LysR family transcriptional regulator [Myxococcota bacterium]
MKLESLDELRVFSQIVESGSMAAAARALGLPTTTVSRRLALLEERLGTRLLYRTTRSLSLAEDGRVLLGRARRILEEAEAAESSLEGSERSLSGVVRMGVPSVLTQAFLHQLAPLLREHPGLRLQLAVHDRLVNPASAGLDLVVMGGTLDDSSLVSRRLGQIRLVLAASESYLQRRGRPRRPADLVEHDTLHFLRDPPVSSWVLVGSKGARCEVPIEVRFEASDGRALLDAMHAGVGIGTLSERLLADTPGLVRVLPRHSFQPFPIHALYPSSGRRSARLRAVLQSLEAALS